MAILSLGLFLAGNRLEAPQALSFLFGVIISNSVNYSSKILEDYSKILLYRIILSSIIIGTVFLALKQIPYVRAEFYGTHIYDFIQMMINIPYAISLMTIVFRFRKIITSKMLLFTGAISYELYLIHFPFYGIVNGNLFYVLVFFIGSYLGAWVYKLFITKFETAIKQFTHKHNEKRKNRIFLS